MKNTQLRTFFKAAFASTALFASAASAQEACSTYTVSDGDTLATIALAAYGVSDYQNIFNANRSVINNPNVLSRGLVLQLPCLDGSLPNGLSADQVIQQQEQFAAARPNNTAYQPPIRIVTVSNWPPFASDELEGGGMFPRLATTALNRGENNRDFTISYVDDWDSHLSVLLPLGAFDVSLAWTTPDCSKDYVPGGDAATRCSYLSTVPAYETITAFYSLADSSYAQATSYEQFRGSRFCVAEGFPSVFLEENNVMPPALELMILGTPLDCMEAVLLGTADIASATPGLFDDLRSQLNITGEIVENPFVNYQTMLTFYADRSNPKAPEIIAMLNRGLNEMRESGEWYAVVSQALRAHNEALMADEQ
ncbi:peptidoglycan-binding protein LysM [Thalassobius sp. I31.1]|uniref:peptidoglycan-binding protein LysM n=1 Tax=Thalassobius sp. I31.1 TaxID=2109912 RepID=UPI000D1A3F24|nr:peptidoglycan-binding protein LysM [Thalassobius sp. I31.1]